MKTVQLTASAIAAVAAVVVIVVIAMVVLGGTAHAQAPSLLMKAPNDEEQQASGNVADRER